MRLHFDPGLAYQAAAIDAACDLFRGQENYRSAFAITLPSSAEQLSLEGERSDLGIGNALALTADAFLRNLRAVQLRNGLAQAEALGSRDFTLEMETGTGKTYVYLRTILELNKRYGFTKFVIVVPSIAVKEGVYKTLEMTREHFRSLFEATPYEYFVYDSSRLGQVRNFAASTNVQIMVVTVGAINKKDVNNLYKPNEKTSDERPVDLIRATQPIIIVDEPQSVDGGLKGAGRTALAEMEPLCTLRYSATHADPHHMIYRLDAVDAYEQRLVKQIEIAGATVEDAHNRPYVELLTVNSRRGDISARVRVDVQHATDVRRDEITVHDGDDLEALTKRSLYRGYRIGELRAPKNGQSLELRSPGGDRFLAPGEAIGDVDQDAVQRELIRRTIREHFEKQIRLRVRGIKVLSLFFLDAVDRYRRYDADGNATKGPCAIMFEEEYARLTRHPDYRSLFDANSPSAAGVHDGYFSIDKSRRWTDTAEGNQVDRDNAERAYNLIMRDKEKLLGFDTPLAFIFSHSALREGWDNPNVFQICSLRDMRSERERRQTIGRGLRICVNQDGERVQGFETNTLTVIATESYESFAAGLQHEIEEATGIRFGVVEPGHFATVALMDESGAPRAIGAERSRVIWDHLRDSAYINAAGHVQDALRAALRDGTLSLPPFITAKAAEIEAILRRVATRVEIRNRDDQRPVRLRKTALKDARFVEMWDRISPKTVFSVDFDSDALARACAGELAGAPPIPSAHLQWRTAGVEISRSGVATVERPGAQRVALAEHNVPLPDILSVLEERTGLTRRTICRILIDSARLDDFKRNPQRFIEVAEETITRSVQHASVEKIRYRQLGPAQVYAAEMFNRETVAYLKEFVEDSQAKTPFDGVACDSETEAAFARELSMNESVKFFAKLPREYKIPTPLDAYVPDWAVVIEEDGLERLYFVVETKGSLNPDQLRPSEKLKIACGKAHFEAVRVREPQARYIVASNVDDLMDQVVAASGS